ncbi:MAG: IclR family transcriptional regulator [Gemmatimonadales bacterium]
MGKPRYTHSVARALAVLDHLASADATGLGVTELSRRLGVHRSTSSRVLMTLQRAGFVERDPVTEKYCAGERVLELASRVPPRLQLRHVAEPYLRRLEGKAGETVTLAAFQGFEAVTLAFVRSRHLLSATPENGRPAPAHCTALGKSLLAFQPESVIARVLERELVAYTPRTITDIRRLRIEIDRIRKRGYALSIEERELALTGVAAPVRDSRGEVVASVGISGPLQRLTPKRLEQLAPDVVEAADDLSGWLGYQPGVTAQGNGAKPT